MRLNLQEACAGPSKFCTLIPAPTNPSNALRKNTMGGLGIVSTNVCGEIGILYTAGNQLRIWAINWLGSVRLVVTCGWLYPGAALPATVL